jgi:hypothetical protein
MESILLMDSERYDATNIRLTFYAEDGVRWLKDFAFKFILVDGVLVIGPAQTHKELWATFLTWNLAVDDAKAKIHEIWFTTFIDRKDRSVSAAGEIDVNGVVTGWRSEGFKVETPEDQRPEIAATILRLYEAGKLIIKHT